MTVAAAVGLALIARGRAKVVSSPEIGVSQAPPQLTPRVLKALPARSSAPTDDELELLHSYIEDSRTLNRQLRRGALEPEWESSVAAIDSWMSNSTPVNGRYYRGVASEQDAEFFRNASVGATYTDRGYGSFSSTFRIAKGFSEEHSATVERVIVRTRAPFYAMPTEAIDALHKRRGTFWETSGGEDEFLAPRGANYRVTQIRKGISSGGRWRKYTLVDLEYTGVNKSRALPPARL